MDPVARRRGYVNYPEPMKGPDLPFKQDSKSNPVLTGPVLLVCAFIMEWAGWIRSLVWLNAGFGALRKIRFHIEDYEPLFVPEIVPQPDPSVPLKASPGGPDMALPKALLPPPSTRFPDTRYYSAADYQALYLSGRATPTDVARTLLPLIRKEAGVRGAAGPGKHAIAWFETQEALVMAAAEASTERYRAGQPLGPLDGVPTAVKDEYDISGYRTCLGSVNDYTGTFVETHADDNLNGASTNNGAVKATNTSWCVRRLQAAGCVILGKLHMVEFGLDTPGNNIFHGTPPNPFNAGYYTGGSSSGAGYAVGAGLVPFALGSDGGGSVRIPASFCSVYGLKPTHGRLSFKPGQNHCITCACLGPLAADVRTLATVYAVLGQPHPTSLFPPVPLPSVLLDRSIPSFPPPAASPSPSDKGGGRILGIPEAWFGRADPAVQELCRSFIDRLVRDHGYRTVPIEIPFLPEGQTAHALTVLADAATLLPVTSNLTTSNRILIALGRTTPVTDYLLAQKLRRALLSHLSYLWHQHPGMVIVTPTTSCAGWPIRSPRLEGRWGISDGDVTRRTMEYVWLANFCGLPALSLPAGYVVPKGSPNAGAVAPPDLDTKVPVGIMMTGEWATETDLLRIGLDAEELVAERIARAPIWEDVLARATALHSETSL